MSDEDDNPFTSPHPLDEPLDQQPIEPEFDPDGFAAVAGDDDGEMMLVNAEASCHKCSHFGVCAVYAGIRPMMRDWHTDDAPDEEAPIQIDKLAWICEMYDPEPESESEAADG